jgi:hypothetical protein
MAKKYTIDYIALEVQNFEKKVSEFQKYLRDTNPAHIGDAKERQAEFTLQMKMMIDIGSMLQMLALLREKAEKVTATRGDIIKSGLMEDYDEN